MSEKTLKFDIRVNKKKFRKSKQPVNLDLVNVDQIAVSDKFKHIDFIGYKEGTIVKPLCINLPQVTGHIKYFENRGKKIVFMIEDGSVLIKYNEFHKSIQFHSTPVYDKKHINLG